MGNIAITNLLLRIGGGNGEGEGGNGKGIYQLI
jgi:hypothetical protein